MYYYFDYAHIYLSYTFFSDLCRVIVVLLFQEGKKFGCPEYNPDQSLKHMYERLKVGQIGINEIALFGASSQSQDTKCASISNGNDQ